MGTDFASNLLSSYPVLCRRDLGAQFGSMLRPTARPWFHTCLKYQETPDTETKQWLKAFEDAQRRAMYDPKAFFNKAANQGDDDVAAFGQAALSVEINRQRTGLMYRCWHLKDMAWQENADGALGCIFRKWKTDAQTLKSTFGDRVHHDIEKALEKEPFKEFCYLHMVVESEVFDEKTDKPYWHIWYDLDHDELVHKTPAWTQYYVIPRWQTVSGSQYSYSPATVCALPDARLLQAMSWTLMEAGERATWPPMIATVDAVRSDIGNYAGGITWVDPEYDEKLGEALRPLSQDFRGFGFGMEMNADARGMINKAFFLDTLKLPERGPEMTAREISARTQQYIRDALPLFEPLEHEYNAAVCEMSFELLWREGAFGAPISWPKSLQGADISFQFESPLHDVIEEMKGQKFIEGSSLIASAMQLDPSSGIVVKSEVALRDALLGIGVEPKWLNTEAEVETMKKQIQQRQEAQQMLQAAQQAGAAAKDFGAANESLANA